MNEGLIELFNEIEPKSDKFRGHNYGNYYPNEFNPKRDDKLNILEIGINYGYSINLWSKFFVHSKIYGVDIKHMYGNLLDNLNNVELFIEDAYSVNFANKFDDEYFDYIIDDGSHTVEHQIKAIELFYSKLKMGGKLIIEDIQGMDFVAKISNICDKKGLNYKVFDLRGRVDDLIIEITK